MRHLHRYLDERFPHTWVITIADNASPTAPGRSPPGSPRSSTACGRCASREGPRAGPAHRVDGQRGPGRRLHGRRPLDRPRRAAPPRRAAAVAATATSPSAPGSRPSARVVRGPKRELISRDLQPAPAHDAARRASPTRSAVSRRVRADVAHALLPLVEDEGWFFDTELLVLAEHNGLRIHEVPVDWVDDPVSRVDILRTAAADLRGVWRLLQRFARGDGELDTRPAPHARRRPARAPGRAVRVDRRGEHRGVRGAVRAARRAPRA